LQEEKADKVDEDGVLIQDLPPAKLAAGNGIGGGPGAQVCRLCIVLFLCMLHITLSVVS